MHVAAIIAAGGRGERLGGRVAKPLRIIGDRTMLERSIAPFDTSDRIDEIVVVLPPDVLSTPPPALAAFSTPLRLVSGGGRRQDSVAAGFDAVTSTADIVVVHDAARPFCSVELIAATVDAAFESGAAIAALPTRDTVKEGRIEEGIGFRFVSATLERDRIFLAQTPQAFRVDVLREAVALGRGGLEATDEAVLAERAGHRIRLIEGEPRNIKVTTDADLSFARDMAAAATTRQHARVGLGSTCIGWLTAGDSCWVGCTSPVTADFRAIPMRTLCVTRSPTRCSARPVQAISALIFRMTTIDGGMPQASTCSVRRRRSCMTVVSR